MIYAYVVLDMGGFKNVNTKMICQRVCETNL